MTSHAVADSIALEKRLMAYCLRVMRLSVLPYKRAQAGYAALSVKRLNELFAQRDGAPPAETSL